MAHPRRSRGFQKVIDSTRWDGSSHVFLAQVAGATAQTFITDGLVETLMRIRGEIVVTMDGALSPGRLIDVAVGLLVVQAGSGTTVIQKPITDADAPWLLYERFVVGYEEPVTDVIDMPGLTVDRRIIDNKAMRILREGREVQLVVEQASLDGADEVNITLVHRTLLGSH